MIFTIGYQGKKQMDLIAAIRREGATLVDVRYNPFVSNPDWHRNTFKEALGEHYLHLKSLGNENYRGVEIRFVDLAGGLERVLSLASSGNVVLMCACRSFDNCHRSLIAKELTRQGQDVKEFSISPHALDPTKPLQTTLF